MQPFQKRSHFCRRYERLLEMVRYHGNGIRERACLRGLVITMRIPIDVAQDSEMISPTIPI